MGGQEEVEDEGIDKMVQGRREEMLDDATAVGEGREMEPWNPSSNHMKLSVSSSNSAPVYQQREENICTYAMRTYFLLHTDCVNMVHFGCTKSFWCKD